MKKIIISFMTIIIAMSFYACGNNENKKVINEENPTDNTFIINGKKKEIADYKRIEEAFTLLYKDNYKNMVIYDTNELTAEILENRTQQGNIIIERVIGMVTNRNQKGDGLVLNTSDNEHNYISYRNMDFYTCDGTIILTYLVYNPETCYIDDIIHRYDFILDREYED